MIVELYKFSIGTTVYPYTTSPKEIGHQGTVYEPSYVKRDSIKGTDEIARMSIKVNLPRDAAFAVNFVAAPPAIPAELELYQSNGSTTALVWLGRVLTVEFAGSEAICNCLPIYSSIKRAGVTARFQKNCRHLLYGPLCRLDANDFVTVGTVTSFSTLWVSASAFTVPNDDWFRGGYIEYGPLPERRMVINHQGTRLDLDRPISGITVGDTVKAYAGCNHSFSTCRSKFNNEDNFGGFPYIPSRNPFGSDPVF